MLNQEATEHQEAIFISDLMNFVRHVNQGWQNLQILQFGENWFLFFKIGIPIGLFIWPPVLVKRELWSACES